MQTACEPHDLNIDFQSFDNVFTQLCATNSMQEYRFNMLMKNSVDPDQLASGKPAVLDLHCF